LSRLILVPQGAEFQAVRRGLSRSQQTQPTLMAIPIGIAPVTQCLAKLELPQTYSHVLVMGLCGSLSHNLAVGDAVVYQTCQELEQQCQQCQIIEIVNSQLVRGLTTDRVITQATEKQKLQQMTGCDVVDMEGIAILQFFQPLGIPVSIVRVVSDDLSGDLPDLVGAIDPDGNLKPLPLAFKLFQQPRSAWRLIRGSMQGLQRLEKLAASWGRSQDHGGV
jgi:purine-nucleoside phosphorylase